MKTFKINDLDYFALTEAIRRKDEKALNEFTDFYQKRFGVQKGFVITDLAKYKPERSKPIKFPFELK